METVYETIENALQALDWQRPPENLYAPIGYTLSSGGKRLRPALLLMACNAFSGNRADALPAALAIEIFHNFTLLHDDLMDKADVRRGKPTVHRRWCDNVAVLSGDTMQIKAFETLAGVPERHLKKCLALFSKMAVEICEGQQYDMDFESRQDVSVDEYLEMIRLKTAVLLGTSLRLGAEISGAPADDAQRIYDFGINIGMAFQLQDDLLDVYGNPETFGKRIGGDILCNKKTFMLISALLAADAPTEAELRRWLQAESFDENEKIKSVTEIYNKLKIREMCERKMDAYYDAALRSLAQIALPDERKTELCNLARTLMKREV